MDNISAHLSYKEATYSNTATKRGISNDPTPEHLKAMKQLAEKVFEPVRVHFNKPMRVNSFYRSPELNKAIGGSSSSQHCKGEAIDIDGLKGLTNAEIFHYIKDNLDWDQMIWEFGNDENPDWVHVSYKLSGTNRKEMRRAVKKNGKTSYPMWKDPNPAAVSGSSSGGTSGSSSNATTGTVTASSLNVRSTPGGDRVGSLKRNQEVEIHEEKDGWYRITRGSTKGWVSAQYIS